MNRRRFARIAARWATELADVETFFLASRFYNELSAGFEQIAQLRDLSQTMLLPVLDAPPSIFFEADPAAPGALRLEAKYAWYRSGMQHLAHQARCITVVGDTLLRALDAAPDSARPPLDSAGC